jgi:hypothetical protein
MVGIMLTPRPRVNVKVDVQAAYLTSRWPGFAILDQIRETDDVRFLPARAVMGISDEKKEDGADDAPSCV